MITIKEYIEKTKKEMKDEISSLPRIPSFTIVQVNDDAASNAYVKAKLKDAEELGINANLIKLPLDTSEQSLLNLINELNNDFSCDGFIVQMPLPPQINEERVKNAISPSKDVDGFHPLSTLNPCTPQGIINFLKVNNYQFIGKNAVVIGRSNIVGKPMARLLVKESCNVTILHSKTSKEDMAFYLEHADLIVIAIGRAGFLDNRFNYKKDAIVIDVGISRTDDGLKGDAVPNLNVGFQTPVPGGVGLLTRLALEQNLLLLIKSLL